MAKAMPVDMGTSAVERLATKAGSREDAHQRSEAAKRQATVRKVPVGRLRAHELQPPERTAADGVQDLVDSIRAVGLLEPPLVRRLPDGQNGILVGHRRVQAWQILARHGEVEDAMPVLVLSGISDADAIYIVAAEESHGKDWDTLHRARVIGAAAEARRKELGREPSSRDLAGILAYEKSSICAYRKVNSALQDPRLAPLVQRLANPAIDLLYNVLGAPGIAQISNLLDLWDDQGPHAVERALKERKVGKKGGRPLAPVTRRRRGDGYDMTVRYRPSMSAEDAATAVEFLRRTLKDLEMLVGAAS